MSSVKIAITLDEELLVRVAEKLDRMQGNRLAAECAKLDPAAEKRLAEAGLGRDLDAWPEY
jgi:hypothetical protein